MVDVLLGGDSIVFCCVYKMVKPKATDMKHTLSPCGGRETLACRALANDAPNLQHASFFCKKLFCGYLVLGPASGLEAFNREPPDDSIGALAFRQTPETSDLAWEFLSYYPILPSRYLRDP